MTSVRTENSMKCGCEQQAQISESALRKKVHGIDKLLRFIADFLYLWLRNRLKTGRSEAYLLPSQTSEMELF